MNISMKQLGLILLVLIVCKCQVQLKDSKFLKLDYIWDDDISDEEKEY